MKRVRCSIDNPVSDRVYKQASAVVDAARALFNAMDELYSIDSDAFDELDLDSVYNELDFSLPDMSRRLESLR